MRHAGYAHRERALSNARGRGDNREELRALATAVLAPVLIVGGVIAVPAIASAVETPPSKTPQQVLALIADAKDAAYSGTIERDLRPGPSRVAEGWTRIVIDRHRRHVDGARPAHRRSHRPGVRRRAHQAASASARHTGRTRCDSRRRRGVGLRLEDQERRPRDAHSARWPHRTRRPTVEALEPGSRWPTGSSPRSSRPPTCRSTSTASVAGRGVYQLELTPKSGTTLVEDVTLSVDAKTGAPLEVVVDARGQSSDAFSVGFRSIDFSTPDASTFEFTPPPGATRVDADAAVSR